MSSRTTGFEFWLFRKDEPSYERSNVPDFPTSSQRESEVYTVKSSSSEAEDEEDEEDEDVEVELTESPYKPSQENHPRCYPYVTKTVIYSTLWNYPRERGQCSNNLNYDSKNYPQPYVTHHVNGRLYLPEDDHHCDLMRNKIPLNSNVLHHTYVPETIVSDNGMWRNSISSIPSIPLPVACYSNSNSSSNCCYYAQNPAMRQEQMFPNTTFSNDPNAALATNSDPRQKHMAPNTSYEQNRPKVRSKKRASKGSECSESIAAKRARYSAHYHPVASYKTLREMGVSGSLAPSWTVPDEETSDDSNSDEKTDVEIHYPETVGSASTSSTNSTSSTTSTRMSIQERIRQAFETVQKSRNLGRNMPLLDDNM